MNDVRILCHLSALTDSGGVVWCGRHAPPPIPSQDNDLGVFTCAPPPPPCVADCDALPWA